MRSSETEICRHPNGSIDTDHYVRLCHRQRSFAAHKAIGRFLTMIKVLIGGTSEKEQYALTADKTRSLSTQKETVSLTRVVREAA